MISVILATSVNELNEAVQSTRGIEILAIENNRENVVKKALEKHPEVVVLAGWLPGDSDILDIAHDLLSIPTRIVFLAGSFDKEDVTVKKLEEYGVQDILFGEVKIGQLIDRIFNITSYETFDNAGEDIPPETTDIIEDDEDKRRLNIKRLSDDIKKGISEIKPAKKIKENGCIEKVIAAASPVPSGKTFISLNFAATLALQGYEVALVDLDIEQFAVCNWLQLPNGEDGLIRALEDPEEPFMYAYQTEKVPGLWVFSADCGEVNTQFTGRAVTDLLVSISENVDVIILDMPRDLDKQFAKIMLKIAGTVMVVADSDYSHLLQLQNKLDSLVEKEELDYEKVLMVVNRVINSGRIPLEYIETKLKPLNADYIIPEKTREVLDSIIMGIPLALADEEIRSLLESEVDTALQGG